MSTTKQKMRFKKEVTEEAPKISGPVESERAKLEMIAKSRN